MQGKDQSLREIADPIMRGLRQPRVFLCLMQLVRDV